MILMGSRTQKKLANLLIQLIENENKIEKCRLALFKSPHIDLFQVYQQIDVPRRGYFKNDEIAEFLSKNNVVATTKEIKYLIDSLDTDKDTFVTFDNFLNFIAPQQDEALRKEIIAKQRMQVSEDQNFQNNNQMPTPQKMKQSNLGASAFMSTAKSKDQHSPGYQANQSFQKQQEVRGLDPEIEFLLTKLIYQMIQNFKSIEAKKEILHQSKDFQYYTAFQTIDVSGSQKLDKESFEEYLKKHGHQIHKSDLLVLLRTYGSLEEGFINEEQFTDMILPVDFNYKKQTAKQSYSKPDQINQSISQHFEKQDRLVEPKRSVNFVGDEEELNISQIPTSKQNNVGSKTNIPQNTTFFSSFPNSRKQSEDVKTVMAKSKLTNDVYLNQSQPDNNQSTIKKPLNVGPMQTPYSKKLLSTIQGHLGNVEVNGEEYNEIARDKFRGSAMKGDEQEFFVKQMHELVLSDVKLEEMKQELSTQKDFNLLDSFQFIDLQGKGFISQQDLFVNLRHLGLQPTKDQIYLFFKQYDLDYSNKLEFSEFVKTFIPIEQNYRNILNNRMATGNGFQSQTKHLLKELFSAILQNCFHVENIRQQLNRRRLFNTYDAFCAIDQDSNGFITMEDIRTLFLDYDIHFSPKDIYYFFRRFDKTLDGEVCYGEFFSELTPKCPFTLQEQYYTQCNKSMTSMYNIKV